MPTSEEILETFPDFTSEPTDEIKAIWLDLADKQTAVVSVWGDEEDVRNLAVALLAAHMMARGGLVEASISSGGIKSESIGSASVTYADGGAVSSALGDLGSTTYGQQLAALREAYIMAPRTSAG